MPLIVEFLEENEPIGTGGFRTAYRAKTKHPQFSSRTWVVKWYLQNTIKGIHDLGQTVEQHNPQGCANAPPCQELCFPT